MINLTVVIPSDINCKTSVTDDEDDLCLLQWRYVMASHVWPCLNNGTLNVACGPQPEARACADVRIGAAREGETTAAAEGNRDINIGKY